MTYEEIRDHVIDCNCKGDICGQVADITDVESW